MKTNSKDHRLYSLMHSIYGQIISTFLFLILFVVLVLWFANTFFLSNYYIKDKINAMEHMYTFVNDVSDDNLYNNDDFLQLLEKEHANHNLSVSVLSSDGDVIVSTNKENFGAFSELFYTIMNQQNEDSQILLANDSYMIQRQEDRRLGEDYLVLWGTLDNGYLLLVRSSIESMKESAKISNRFLFFIGFLTFFICGILGMFFAKRITKPLGELLEISKKMSELDFEAKYQSFSGTQEVDALGNCMNQMSETLEKTIVELQQANYDLRKDIERKEAQEKKQRDFVANVSHELKTPIALISGYAEGLQEGVFEDEESREEYCAVILDEAQKMNRMIMSLISLSQIETGQDQVTYERFDVTEVISNMLPGFYVLAEKDEISISFEQYEPCYVYADEYLVELVLSNYLSNAIHYAKYLKQIEIRMEKKERSVRILVYNTGDQIPDDCIAFIWDKFYKVDRARTRAYGGTGIGLSVVKAIMDEFDQEYGVENKQNGVEFWFELERKIM